MRTSVKRAPPLYLEEELGSVVLAGLPAIIYYT